MASIRGCSEILDDVGFAPVAAIPKSEEGVRYGGHCGNREPATVGHSRLLVRLFWTEERARNTVIPGSLALGQPRLSKAAFSLWVRGLPLRGRKPLVFVRVALSHKYAENRPWGCLENGHTPHSAGDSISPLCLTAPRAARGSRKAGVDHESF